MNNTRTIKTSKGNDIEITALGFHRFEVSHNGKRIGEFTYLAHSKNLTGWDVSGCIGLGTYAQPIVEALDEAATEERMFRDYAALTPAERAARVRAEYNKLQHHWAIAQDEGLPLAPIHRAIEAHRARYAEWDARLA